MENSVDNLRNKSAIERFKSFNFEKFLYNFRIPLALLLVGAIIAGFGVFYSQIDLGGGSTQVEVLETNSEGQSGGSKIVVEIAGAVEKPGVYEFNFNDRVEDLLIIAGGVTAVADRDWMDRFLNRAAKLSDGQKLYIPYVSEQSEVASAKDFVGDQSGSSSRGSPISNFVNINTATLSELESLWGIGPVTGRNIIEQRPYSTVEELLEKKILKTNVFERNKDLMTVY